jgi:poly(3-hydroxybutyrate) depolymerase
MVPVLLFFRIFLLLNQHSLILVDPAAGAIRQGTIQMRDLERAYRYYIPSNLKSGVYYPEKDHDKRTSIKRLTWQADSHAEVSLYIIKGGGHNPQAKFMAPEVYGKTVTKINGPQEIWIFFQRQVESAYF